MMQTPREIDTRLAELEEQQERASYRRSLLIASLHEPVGDLRSRDPRCKVSWQLTDAEALERAGEIVFGMASYAGAYPSQVAEIFRQVTELEAELALIAIHQLPLEAEYESRQWNRYYLVLNENGHVHRERSCRTCFLTTRFGWLPELSGCDEAEMIAEFGESACTVCFPDAPANPAFHGPGRRDREAVEARAAEKAERDAKKAAKALTGPERFRIETGRYGEWIETVAACKEALRHEVELRDYYGRGVHPHHAAWAEGAEQAKKVLLAREERQPGTGATQVEIDKIIANAVKKNRREGARI